MRRIYLDFNATTPIAPSVVEAMQPFLTEHYGNPSSDHVLGRAAAHAVEDAREQVAHLLDADPDEILFTSGGTESNNLALKGVMCREPRGLGGHLVISSLEHPAIVQPARFLEWMGNDLTICACAPDGVVSPDAVEQCLRDDTRLVSIMLANNEIGTIQPIGEITRRCHARGILVHTDAAQVIGKIRCKVDDLGVDLLSVAGHKFYAPKGVGALYVRRGTQLEPLLHGAAHEGGWRAGTENVPYIVALGAAARLAARGSQEVYDRLQSLRDRMFELLLAAIGPDLTLNGKGAERLPNTLSVNFPDVIGGDLLARIPELCASTGAACHSGQTAMSATLSAIGVAPEVARGSVRLTVGWPTSKDEVERAAELLIEAWEALRA